MVDSEPICLIKKYHQILREKDQFDLLKYIYHIENLDKSQIELMNKTIETGHPGFDTQTRSYIDFPEVQRMTVKIKEATKLKNLTFLGVSTDPEKDIQLKTEKDLEFEWPSGSLYLHYPVYRQSVVGFGKSTALGQTKSANFKIPAISDPEEEDSKKFEPVRVVGSNNYTAVVSKDGSLFETGNINDADNKERLT
jgi:hypothetical protein